jgi:hypothetical protein
VTTNTQPSISRPAQALIVSASLLLIMFLMGVALLVVAVQERVVQLPSFVVHVGHYYLTAPCPAPTLVCDPYNNFYAVWRGYDLPDGRIHFDEMFFTVLKPKR